MSKLYTRIRAFVKDEEGLELSEYAVMALLIATALVTVVTTLGTTIQGVIQGLIDALT